MRAATLPDLIDVQALRIGMFVHLDGGWMSHPFPLSNFKITSAAQVATIRSLGLRRVRWSPQHSDPGAEPASGSPVSQMQPTALAGCGVAAAAAATAAPAAAAAANTANAADTANAVNAANAVDAAHAASVAVSVANFGAGNAPVAQSVHSMSAAAPQPPAGAFASLAVVPERPASLDAPPVDEAAVQRHRLAAQREALAVCEQQFGEASKTCAHMLELAPKRPQQARAQAESLTHALLGKMLGQHELCIRLLTETAGDRSSMHVLNVAIISMLMGRTFGFGESEMQDLGVGALLHDIGKIELPERLRYCDDSFSPSERKVYEEHVAHGVQLARKMGLSPGAMLVIAQHHEHADGSGFPLRLNTDRLTHAARIVALVNRYDNLCNPRVAARALTPHESLSLLFAQGQAQLDTAILGAFIKMMGVYPPGSAVQLTDDRYALVIAVNSSRPLKPSVQVYDPAVPRDAALPLDLENAPGLGIRRSIKPQQLPPAALDYLAPRQRVAYYFEAVPCAAPMARSAR